ncbi:hypothetical protein ANRL3_01271 [Anaerolineae bacterium]|nr:hypothetical protein ANRL3_01271 [Anaerolineae bacterium]
MNTELTAAAQRAQDATFVATCKWQALQERLPLRWPTPPDIPPCPKKTYRSHYVYRGARDLDQPATWEHVSDFDLVLRLIDFDGLRPVLAQRLGWVSARGYEPFDPLSFFLLLGWQITNHWNRTATLRHLADARYADYAHRFGFEKGVLPTEGGVRYFLTALGQHAEGDPILIDEAAQLCVGEQRLNALITQSVELIRAAGVLSTDAWSHALICPDGMIHAAASRMDCTAVTDTCYQPTTPETPRACPAQDKGHQGCACNTLDCASLCQHAPARDADARVVYYAGSNRPAGSPNQTTNPGSAPAPRGKLFYGYRSLPLQLSDATRRFSLILSDDFRPANEREEPSIAAQLLQLSERYPTLHVDAVAGDAAFGCDLTLRLVHDRLRARRVIDLRAHETDRDKAQWPVRGYDDKGRPVCPFGYTFTANGFDATRLRHKWVCGHACQHGRTPCVQLPEVVYPPPREACAYLGEAHPHGEVRNIAARFGDGSMRLVRDIPVGTPTWKAFYHRARNAVESRNATMESWDLKRLPVYGLARGKALVFQADVWLNLTTLARLVREATLASQVT